MIAGVVAKHGRLGLVGCCFGKDVILSKTSLRDVGDAISLTFAVNDKNRLPALASLHLNSNKIGHQGVEALVESATKKEDGQSGASGDGYSSAVQQLYLRGNVAAVAPEVQLLIDQHPKLTVFL